MLSLSQVEIRDLIGRDRNYNPKLSLAENRTRDFHFYQDKQLRYNRAIVDGHAVQAKLMILEHDHTNTVGSEGMNEDGTIKDGLLREIDPDIPIIPVTRGGTITYHGPGQLVVYHISRIHQDQYLKHKNTMEKFYIDLLSHDFGIDTHSRKRDTPSQGSGAWLMHNGEYRKVVSQGTAYVNAGIDEKTRKPCYATMHGFALNVSTDLNYFHNINPCGYEPKVITSMSEILGRDVKIDEVRKRVLQKIRESE